MTRQEALIKFRAHLEQCILLEPLIVTDFWETGDNTHRLEMYLLIIQDIVK